MKIANFALISSMALTVALANGAPADAQVEDVSSQPGATSEHSQGLDDIIVTANKRQQSVNDVGLTIATASGAELLQRGVSSTADLAKIVPGLTAQASPFNTPVYTLRGVGFYESSLAASPTVAVYTDEIALPFSAMTRMVALDLERVEVLKGPQGTLFGNNTTGGAINFVAAKPTDAFEAGVDVSYGRFNTVDMQGYLSGPVADNLRARLSGRFVNGGDWQYSATRNDTLGATRQGQVRLLLDWDATDRLAVKVNLNGWIDKSDTQAPQRIATYISSPTSPQAPQNLAFPYPSRTPRAADWSFENTKYDAPPIPPMRKDDSFIQGSVRADYEVSADISLTSITAYERYKTHSVSDFDGTSLQIADNQTYGKINTFFQELRLSGKASRLNWVVGGNFEKDKTHDSLFYWFGDSTTSQVGPLHASYTNNFSDIDITTIAAFANVEYEFVDRLSLQAGARYTDTKHKYMGCSRDVPGTESLAPVLSFLEQAFRDPNLPFIPINPGDCFSLQADFAPLITPLEDTLHEDNLSWRIALNYKTPGDGIIYGSVSKGYKSGSYPTLAAALSSSLAPVQQESLLAYEIGFKQPFANGLFQLNGAAFYYDYKDKQLRGRIPDIVFGPQDALVQIPKSRVWGVEAELRARPLDGLNLSGGLTYLNTKITEYTGLDPFGGVQDLSGYRFPYSPKWQAAADIQYEWALNASLDAYVGASGTYNSSTYGLIAGPPELDIDAYALLDLRAGVQASDDSWRFELWGRNVTNNYYWTQALQSQDVYVRYTGKPATYGIRFSHNF